MPCLTRPSLLILALGIVGLYLIASNNKNLQTSYDADDVGILDQRRMLGLYSLNEELPNEQTLWNVNASTDNNTASLNDLEGTKIALEERKIAPSLDSTQEKEAVNSINSTGKMENTTSNKNDPDSDLSEEEEEEEDEKEESRFEILQSLPSGQQRHRIALVAQLGGHMANNLAWFAHAYAMKFAIEREHPSLYLDVIAEHQKINDWKWKHVSKKIRRCFPRLKNMTFRNGIWDPEYPAIKAQQELFEPGALVNVDNACGRPDCWRDSANWVERVLEQQRANPHNTSLHLALNSTSQLTLPYLRSEKMSNTDAWVDEFYWELREQFQLDESCCDLRPDPDATLFHFRNFAQEGRRLKYLGFLEMEANQTAHELLKHLGRGDKVTIVTRGDMPLTNVQKYVEAFEARGLNTSVQANDDGMHDFCYLMSAKKELFGGSRSTYALWAGILGDMNATYYRIPLNADDQVKPPKFKRKELQRIRFETYESNVDLLASE